MHQTLTAGASGYLSKETDRDAICDAIIAAAAGTRVIRLSPSPSVPSKALPGLSFGERQQQVLRLAVGG